MDVIYNGQTNHPGYEVNLESLKRQVQNMRAYYSGAYRSINNEACNGPVDIQQQNMLRLQAAEKMLEAAEDALIYNALANMSGTIDRREIEGIRNHCFGLNGYRRSADLRETVIELVMQTDTLTVA